MPENMYYQGPWHVQQLTLALNTNMSNLEGHGWNDSHRTQVLIGFLKRMSVHSVTYWTASCKYTRLTHSHTHTHAAKMWDWISLQCNPPCLKTSVSPTSLRPTSAGTHLENGNKRRRHRLLEFAPLFSRCLSSAASNCLTTGRARHTKQTPIHNSSQLDVNKKARASVTL